MRKTAFLISFLLSATFSYAQADADVGSVNANQKVLTLEECRTMALEHNKAVKMAQLSVEKAKYEHKAAFTNYLPKVNFIGTYQYTNKPFSLVSDEDAQLLTNLGSNLVGGIQSAVNGNAHVQQMQQMAGQIIQQHPELAPLFSQGTELFNQLGQTVSGALSSGLNATGSRIVDILNPDLHTAAIMSVMLTQPLYMGGKIRAYDKITRYSEELAGQKLRLEEQQLVLDVDKAYWQVVSLTNKRQLAVAYRDMLQHLDKDVKLMIEEGVATRANELTVGVKLNEAEMTLMRIDDGLVLSRMLLAQTCGMELDEVPVLADEKLETIHVAVQDVDADADEALTSRPEIRQLDLATNMLKQKVNIERSAFLPQLALTGGYLATYPSFTNGFQKELHGLWNVGLTLKIPVWSWGEACHKVRAAKTEAAIAALRYEEVREKIHLQVKQSAFAVNEANRKLALTVGNLEKAEENLRVAKIGFAEGMIPTSDLLAAQTAWVSAESDKIDAQIDIKLTNAAYNKALGR